MTISRFPIATLEELPDDLRTRIEPIVERSGFIPNIFLALAHRPPELRAFLGLPRCADGAGERINQGRARDGGGGHQCGK